MQLYRKQSLLLFLVLACLILLAAACGGAESPANPDAAVGGDGNTNGANPASVNFTPDANVPTSTIAPTPTPLGTEDPNEGLIFDALTVIRENERAYLEVSVLGNGALLRDGVLVGSVDAETVISLDTQLDEMGFFRLETRYGPTQPGSDQFQYRVDVLRSGDSGLVTTVDGHVPPSLNQLITQVLALEPSGPNPDPTLAPDDPAQAEQ